MVDELSADDFIEIDRLCDEFESSWSRQQQDRFQRHLAGCPEGLRSKAFQELLRVDLELRSRLGETFSSDEYLQMYPEFSELILAVFSTVSISDRTILESPIEADQLDTTFEVDGNRFGRFELRRILGRGSFGAVHLAYDTTLDRDVAIKLPRFAADDRERVNRFLEEARIAANLHHPNIVAVWERGQIDQQYYICSEYVDGRTLETFHDEPIVDLRTRVSWMRDLADALDYAHQENVIHRDLKPANLIINHQNRPMIMDFGLAKRTDVEATRTTDGLIMGTPAYMSPEQARGATRAIGPQTDQYSLGVVFYELLAGRRLRSGSAHEIVALLQRNPMPPDFAEVSEQPPPDLVAVCQKMLQPLPDARYSNCRGVARDLASWLDGHPVTVRRISPIERFVMWCRRNRVISTLALSVAGVLVTALIVVSVALQNVSEARTQAQDNLDVARRKELEVRLERDRSLRAAVAERKEVSRSGILLAGHEIQTGHFQEALAILNDVDESDRNWIWHIQRARIPDVVCRTQLPDNATNFGLRTYYNDSGTRLAVTFHRNVADIDDNFRMVTWLLDTRTGEVTDEVDTGYRVTSPVGSAFTKGGRYLVMFVTKHRREVFQTIGVYDTQTRKLVATRGNVRRYVTSPYRPMEVLIEEMRPGQAQCRYLVWNFEDNNETFVHEAQDAVPYNFSTDSESTELCIRKNNWTYMAGAKPENSRRTKLLHRLGATHWNISTDQKYVVGQLQDVWPWNARGLTVAAGQTAVVEFPLKMVTVLETARNVSPTLFDYQLTHSERIDELEIPRGFFISTDNRYVLLDMVNAARNHSQKKELCWWNFNSGEFIGMAVGMAVSPDGRTFVSEQNGEVVVRSAPARIRRFRSQETESELASWYPIHPSRDFRAYPQVAYVGDTSWVLTGRPGLENVIDSQRHVIHRDFPNGFSIGMVAVDHTHRRLAFHAPGNTVEIISVDSASVVQTLRLEHTGAREFLAFHPNGTDFVTGDVRGIAVWSIATGKMITRYDDYPCPQRSWGGLFFSRSGKYLIVNNGLQRSRILDTESWTSVREGPAKLRFDFSLSRDESLLAVNNGYGRLRIERFTDGEVIREISTDSRDIRAEFHPRHPVLITVRHDGRVVLYDTNTWNVIADESLPRGRGSRIVFDEAGESMAVGLQYGSNRWFEFSADRRPELSQ